MLIDSHFENRVLVVGHRPYFEFHMPETHGTTLVKKLEYYHDVANDAFNEIERFKPNVLLAFRPELIPLSVLLSFAGLKIGFSSEIFPKLVGKSIVGDVSHRDKFKFFDNSAVRRYDELYHYDASSKEFLDNSGIKFSGFPPYPLNPFLFEAEVSEKDIDVLFIGRVSPRRYELLEPLKRKNIRLVSIDHGFYGDDLLRLLTRSKIVLNIHAEDHSSFEPRTLIGAAVGAVIVSEPIPIPEWMQNCPFVFTNDLGSNIVSRVDYALENYEDLSHQARLFRDYLRIQCSANDFIDRCIKKQQKI